jgi:hypothetical protein
VEDVHEVLRQAWACVAKQIGALWNIEIRDRDKKHTWMLSIRGNFGVLKLFEIVLKSTHWKLGNRSQVVRHYWKSSIFCTRCVQSQFSLFYKNLQSTQRFG